jgi:hypothetical protein
VTGDSVIKCVCCGVSVAPEVPEYFIELECFRLMTELSGQIPRRGSPEYHDVMEKLRPEISASYFRNMELYDRGHLWCPMCGSRLSPRGGEDDDFRRGPGL